MFPSNFQTSYNAGLQQVQPHFSEELGPRFSPKPTTAYSKQKHHPGCSIYAKMGDEKQEYTTMQFSKEVKNMNK